MKKKIIAVLLASLLVVVAVVLVLNHQKSKPEDQIAVVTDSSGVYSDGDVTDSKSNAAGKTQKADAEEMAKTLAKSQHKAEKEYQNVTVKMTGTFVEADPQESAYMVLCAITEDDSAADILFNCNLGTEDLRKQILDLKTGDTVTVVGTVTTVDSNSYEIAVSKIST